MAAYMTAVKTRNKIISMRPDTHPRDSAGKSVGAVTTTTVTRAAHRNLSPHLPLQRRKRHHGPESPRAERGKDGKLRVRIVHRHEKAIVEITPVDYDNIGFDGKWNSAPAGTARCVLVVTREPMPATLPWSHLQGDALKEYADLLD